MIVTLRAAELYMVAPDVTQAGLNDYSIETTLHKIESLACKSLLHHLANYTSYYLRSYIRA